MLKYRFTASVLFVLALCPWTPGSAAKAESWFPVTLTLDEALSSLTLIGDIEGAVEFQEQAPGSMTAQGSGAIQIELWGTPGAFTQIRFPGGGLIQPLAQPGPFQPGNAPADFAAFVDLTDPLGVFGYGAFRDDLAELTGDARSIDAGGEFSGVGLTLTVAAGVFYYDVPGFLTGSNDFYFSAPVIDPMQGSISIVGNNIEVVIPYSGLSTTFVSEIGLNFNYGASGQFVGRGILVPEPSAMILALLGSAILWLSRRRRAP